MLVADDGFLNALKALDENVVHIRKENLHRFCPVLRSQVPSEPLDHPLAALRHTETAASCLRAFPILLEMIVLHSLQPTDDP